MKNKIVTVKVSYDTEETWEETLSEVKEILQMMNNMKRNAIILSVVEEDEPHGNDGWYQ